MNWIQNCKFKINGTEFIITAVWWQGKNKVEYEFKQTNWDEPVTLYKMAADEFESKLKIENFVGI